MAWSYSLSLSPEQRLNRIKGWEAKGLPYWQARVDALNAAIRAADNSGTLRRAIARREEAMSAVRILRWGS